MSRSCFKICNSMIDDILERIENNKSLIQSKKVKKKLKVVEKKQNEQSLIKPKLPNEAGFLMKQHYSKSNKNVFFTPAETTAYNKTNNLSIVSHRAKKGYR